MAAMYFNHILYDLRLLQICDLFLHLNLSAAHCLILFLLISANPDLISLSILMGS